MLAHRLLAKEEYIWLGGTYSQVLIYCYSARLHSVLDDVEDSSDISDVRCANNL